MKSLVAVLIVGCLVLAKAIPCAKYECKAMNPGDCGQTVSSETDLTVYLQKCNDTSVCTLTFDPDKNDTCAPTYTTALRYPGEYCAGNEECFSGTCTKNLCQGKDASAACQADIDCNVGLYCNKEAGLCQKAAALNDVCSSSVKCALPGVCNGTTCVPLGQLENGKPALVPALCKSFYVANGNCSPGPKLQGMPENTLAPIKCPPDTKRCSYKLGDAEYKESCECGRGSTEDTYCSPGKGDLNLGDVKLICYPVVHQLCEQDRWLPHHQGSSLSEEGAEGYG